jgi:Fur family transcriptional regulator, ferric uptake regulator
MEIPQQLRESGLKATLPRLKILELFQHSDVRHLSAEDVYRLLLKENLDVGLATIYRVLMQFADAKILLRRQFEGDRAVFEINQSEHHDHMVCVDCGKVEEFFDLAIEERQMLLAKQHGFKLRDHSLSLYGLCKDCVARDRERANPMKVQRSHAHMHALAKLPRRK